MARIIIPIDFTEISENTIAYGIEIAKDFGYPMRLLHVIDNYDYSVGYGTHDTIPNPEVSVELLEEMKKQSAESFSRMEAQLKEKYKEKLPPLETKTEVGFYTQKVLEEVKDENDYIMLTGKIHENIFSRFISEDTNKIVREAPCPVWVVPAESKYGSIRKIVYASDYHEEDIGTLKRLSSLAAVYGAKIHALHIVKNEDFNVKAKQVGFQEMIREKVGYEHIEVQVTMTSEGIEKVDDFAGELDAQLIVMLKENKSFLDRILEGSSTKKLLMHASLPVLIYHERD